jgi:hypothetical protein
MGALAAMAVPGVPGPRTGALKHKLEDILSGAVPSGRRMAEYVEGPLYRESSIEDALNMLPSRASPRVDMTYDRPYFSNAPEYAIGQGANKGVLLEFQPTDLRGRIVKEKPTWQPAYGSGYAELQGEANRQTQYQNALNAITIRPEAAGDRITSRLFQDAIDELQKSGWTKEALEGGAIRLSRPQP